MAKETKKAAVEEKPASKYSKGQVLSSGTFANRRDILSVLLEEGKEYTVAEVERIMGDWLKGRVR